MALRDTTGLDRTHLKLAEIQRLMRFRFVPRQFLQGQYTGRHASPQRGQSVEFRDYRQYLPGDDLSQVDWKVYGRSDKFYVRLFEHETELTVTFLIDASASMNYGTAPGASKYDHACRLAAALAFVILRSQDRAGFAQACEGMIDYQRPSSALPQLMEMLACMERTKLRGAADLAKACEQLVTKVRRGEIVVVISDFWEDMESLTRSLMQLLHKGVELIVFHVLHDDELKLPAWNDVQLVEAETGARLRVSLDEIRADYGRRLEKYLDEVRTRFQRLGIQYQLAPMTEAYWQTLERYLVRRCSH